MDIVTLKEKKVVGITAQTSNQDPAMQQVIGNLWETYYQDTVSRITKKANEKCLGIYKDYIPEGYTVMVGCEVTDVSEVPEGAAACSIPAGRYAKFVVTGNVQTAVAECWQKIWAMNLDRSFVCDFEEYQEGEDIDHMEIHIYVSLNYER